MSFDPEAAVDKMLVDGQKVLEEAIKYVTQDLGTHVIAIVGAFSGGDDSIVATHFANTIPAVCTFNADTMIGLGRLGLT